jgi:hypothetical protein
MEITQNLWKHFIKSFSLPIQVTDTKFMEYYLDLYDNLFDIKSTFKVFLDALNNFDNEQQFLEYEHKLIYEIVGKIKNSTEYCELNNCDISALMPLSKNKLNKASSIYSPNNANKYYVSIDLAKANFQALKYFIDNFTKSTDAISENNHHILSFNNYEEFMGAFTDIELFKISKNLRQVIFGQLNCRRIQYIELYLIEKVLSTLIEKCKYDSSRIVNISHDEIIFEADKLDDNAVQSCISDIIKSELNINVRVESFKLNYIGNNTYIKEHKDAKPTFKGCPPVYMPQAVKAYYNIPIEDTDMLFQYEKQLAKFVTPLNWQIV